MSKTPRVDAAAERGSDHGLGNVMMSGIWPLARQLESENAEMAELLKRIVHGGRASISILEEARALLAKVEGK